MPILTSFSLFFLGMRQISDPLQNSSGWELFQGYLSFDRTEKSTFALNQVVCGPSDYHFYQCTSRTSGNLVEILK